MFLLYLLFHVEVLFLLPLTSKGVNKIFIYKLIPYQQGFNL
jgi:NADH:ubiquinone oxidoreductase subunit 3 (subunit A)